MIELSDRHARISVIMPQKKNPYSLAFVRGMARQMMGRLVSAAAAGATPSGQVDNRIFAYGDVPRALQQTTQAVDLLAGTVAGLTVKPAVMARRAGQGFSGATDLADVIMLQAGLDSGAAHRIVGRAARMALPTDQPLDAGLLDTAAVAIIGRPLHLSDETIAQAMDPLAIIGARTGPGGAAPTSVQAMLAEYRALQDRADRWRLEVEERLATAESKLLCVARRVAGS